MPQRAIPGVPLRSTASHPIVFALLACLLVGADPPADAPVAPPALTPRQQIEQMSQAERDQLAREENTFLALPQAEQDRLQQLHDRLQNEPELRRVMVEYHEWLKTLEPLERAALLSMDPAERIAEIHRLKKQQQAQAARKAGAVQLGDADFQAIFRWLEELAAVHQDQLLRDMPPERRDQVQHLPPQQRRRQLAMAAGMRMNLGTPLGRLLGEEADLNKLHDRLSPDAQAWLDKASTRAQKLELLQAAVQSRRNAPNPRRPLVPIDEQALEQFFAQDLTPQDRDRLLEMPRDEMQRELRRMYAVHKGFDRPNRPPANAPPPRDGGRGPKPMPERSN